jgi:hypothetical protein
MKALFILMLAIMMSSLALLCAAIISGDLVTFAFSTGLSIVSVLGTCVTAGVLDDRRI